MINIWRDQCAIGLLNKCVKNFKFPCWNPSFETFYGPTFQHIEHWSHKSYKVMLTNQQIVLWETIWVKYIYIYVYVYMNFIGHYSFYPNVLQNTQKNQKRKKRQLHWFIESVMRDITSKISWKVTWIDMNEYELANDWKLLQ